MALLHFLPPLAGYVIYMIGEDDDDDVQQYNNPVDLVDNLPAPKSLESHDDIHEKTKTQNNEDNQLVEQQVALILRNREKNIREQQEEDARKNKILLQGSNSNMESSFKNFDDAYQAQENKLASLKEELSKAKIIQSKKIEVIQEFGNMLFKLKEERAILENKDFFTASNAIKLAFEKIESSKQEISHDDFTLISQELTTAINSLNSAQDINAKKAAIVAANAVASGFSEKLQIAFENKAKINAALQGLLEEYVEDTNDGGDIVAPLPITGGDKTSELIGGQIQFFDNYQLEL